MGRGWLVLGRGEMVDAGGNSQARSDSSALLAFACPSRSSSAHTFSRPFESRRYGSKGNILSNLDLELFSRLLRDLLVQRVDLQVCQRPGSWKRQQGHTSRVSKPTVEGIAGLCQRTRMGETTDLSMDL